MWADYANRRTSATLDGRTRLNLTIRRCRNAGCPAYRRPYRPEQEGRVALPRHEFGLDVVALVGALRYAERRSVPEIPRHLTGRGPAVSQRTVTNLLSEVRDARAVPVAAVVSAGQQSIRKAVAPALPGVPHQLCQFHYLREAARPIYEAGRNAKERLKKEVRGVRKIERAAAGRDGPEAEATRGYGGAVRGAWTDDGRPPLEASGLKLRQRLGAVPASLGRAAAKGGSRPNCRG